MTSWDPSATQTVNQLIAGTGVTLSPTSGQGVVTINTSGGSGVTSLIAGTNISLTPTSGLGNVTINAIASVATWVPTAASPLNMNGYFITDLTSTLQIQAAFSTIVSTPHAFFTGDIGAKALVNLSTINGIAYSPASVVSSYTTLNASSFTVSTINGIAYAPASVVSSYTTLNASSFTVSTINGIAYAPASVVSSYTTLSASSFTVSTINGLKYSAPGWVSTATGKLNMSSFNIQDSTGSNLITLCNGINIKDSHGSVITFDTLGEISITGLKQFFVYNTYGDEININNGMYFFPAFQFYVDNTGNGHPGIFTLASASGIEANEIYLTTDFSVGTGSGNINFSSISNTSIYSATTFSNQAQTMYNTVTLSTINSCPETTFSGDVKVASLTQTLAGSSILQPVIQWGTTTGSGATGTVTVTLPTRYTSQASYLPFANMIDSPAAQIFVSSISRASFIIGWSSAGTGTQHLAWNTMGN